MFQRTILAELEFRLKGEAVAGSCNFLVQESCYPGRSGHSVPVNQHQDKCYSLFSNFSSLYEWKSVNTVKSGRQSLEKGLARVFQAVGNILLQKVQTKHRERSARVRAKGTGPIWSHICYLLQDCLCDFQPSFFKK